MNLRPPSPADRGRARPTLNSQNWDYRPMRDLSQVEYVSLDVRLQQVRAVRDALTRAAAPPTDLTTTSIALAPDSNATAEVSVDVLFDVDCPERLRTLFAHTLSLPLDTYEAPPSFIGRYGDPELHHRVVAAAANDVASQYARWNAADQELVRREKPPTTPGTSDKTSTSQRFQRQQQQQQQQQQRTQLTNLLEVCDLDLGIPLFKRAGTTTTAIGSVNGDVPITSINGDGSGSGITVGDSTVTNFTNPWPAVIESMRTTLAELAPPLHPLRDAVVRSAHKINALAK